MNIDSKVYIVAPAFKFGLRIESSVSIMVGTILDTSSEEYAISLNSSKGSFISSFSKEAVFSSFKEAIEFASNIVQPPIPKVTNDDLN